MASLDIVIPAYGRADLLKQCLAALPQGPEVWVIDDGTADLSVREVAKKANVRYIRNTTNLGFVGTVNKGVLKGQAPKVMILNTDVILAEGAIDILMQGFNDPDVGIMAPMLLFPDDSTWETPGKIQHVGIAFNVQGNPFHIFVGWG
jgi:GT2 family glycosyltransferase